MTSSLLSPTGESYTNRATSDHGQKRRLVQISVSESPSHQRRQPTGEFSNYDAIGRLTDIKQQGNGGNTVGAKHVTIAYNALGQRTSLSRYESLATTSFVATTDYTYDTANRLSSLTPKRNATMFAGYGYSYDGLSRLTSANSSVEGVSNFTYDATSQLTVADHTSHTNVNYGYDLNGNRTSRSFLPERTLQRNTHSIPAGWNYSDEGINALLEFNGSAATNHKHRYLWSRILGTHNSLDCFSGKA